MSLKDASVLCNRENTFALVGGENLKIGKQLKINPEYVTSAFRYLSLLDSCASEVQIGIVSLEGQEGHPLLGIRRPGSLAWFIIAPIAGDD